MLFAVLPAISSSASAAEIVVRRITVQFETLESGKSFGTAVSVFVQDGNGIVAEEHNFASGVAFRANSRTGQFTIPLTTHGPITAGDLRDFIITAQSQAPTGKSDTWRFNLTIEFHMSNGGVITRTAGHLGLRSVNGSVASVSHRFH